MANWCYYSKDDKKIIVSNEEELKYHAKMGMLTPDTIIKDEEGRSMRAGHVKGLTSADFKEGWWDEWGWIPFIIVCVAVFGCVVVFIILPLVETIASKTGLHKFVVLGLVGLWIIIMKIAYTPSNATATMKHLFCTNCGNFVANMSVPCQSCGAAPDKYRKFCRQCGTALNPEQVICVKCNANIADQSEQQGAWAQLALFGGLALGVSLIIINNNLTYPTPFLTWGGIIVIIVTIADFLVKLTKLSKK